MPENKFKQVAYQATGADTHVKSRESRLAQTPKTAVIWSGENGVSKCYPIDPQSQTVLAKYGQAYIQYDRTGEPNFSPCAEASVKIADMCADRQKNFSSAGKKLLDTDWAKERNISTLSQLSEYRKAHSLTWHECSDGVTMQLVPTEINSRFGHSGGVSEWAAMETAIDIKSDGLLRSGGKIAGTTSIRVRQGAVWVADKANPILLKEFTAGAVDALSASAISFIIYGTHDLIRVASGDMELKDAAKDMGKLGSSIAFSGGAIRALNYSLKNSQNTILDSFAKTNQVGKVVIVGSMIARATGKYLDGEIDGAGFMNEIGQDGLSMVSSMLASEAVSSLLGASTLAAAGGAVGLATAAAPVLAAMIASAACAEIYSQAKKVSQAYQDSLEIQYIANSARAVIEQQQDDLKRMMDENHEEWAQQMTVAFQELANGLADNDLQKTNSALRKIAGSMSKQVALYDSGDDLLEDLLSSRVSGAPNHLLKGQN